eukprot:CAMPEP_0117518146 /NCGR_PEP_ID=MMETSP0784-20121206/31982_1 /TAXON_ID=39447 /ORGANISM="" /LENGTH=131 /DNA_ID=CAMNT_0005314059 /DNA_START=69 /DNA_END=464 /DNA_ORIENTATION=-
MAPKAKAAGKAKAKAKATPVKKDSKAKNAPAESKTFDTGSMEEVLQNWSDAKAAETAAHKEVEKCKTLVEAEMLKTGMDCIKTASFEVSKRMQSRESCSKQDLPADIWSKYAKTSEFPVLSLKELKKKGKA